MTNLITLASLHCNVPEEWIKDTVKMGPRRVKHVRVPKRNPAKFRVIARPSGELEILQRWLTEQFFNSVKLHDAAMAFRPKRSIFLNAKVHKNSKYFVRIDFQDFFNSITFLDVYAALEMHAAEMKILFSDDSRHFIKRICFDGKGRLPIGYISSPVLSNIVMIDFDTKLFKLIQEQNEKVGSGVLTRYADDIVFSTDLKGGCVEFLKLVRQLLCEFTSPNLVINEDKTIFSSKAGGSAMVTGLRICSDNHITVTRNYKDKIRLMLSLYRKKELDVVEIPALKGHLSYIRYVAPAFFSKLCIKYVDVIDSLIVKTIQNKVG